MSARFGIDPVLIGTPLANHRHEILCHELVKGATSRDAGIAAGYRDSPSIAQMVWRIKTRPDVRARIAELAKAAAEVAIVDDAWVLSRAKEIAESNIFFFLKRDADGALKLNKRGQPQLDFDKANIDRLRSISGLEYDSRGRLKVRLRDPMPALELLARNRGLLVDKLALTDPSGEAAARMYVVTDQPLSEDEWLAKFGKPRVPAVGATDDRED